MKEINRAQYDQIVFCVDSIGKLSDIPFDNQLRMFSFFESRKSMIYATCLITMLILSETTIFFFDFPVKIWVALFMVYPFHGSMILQSGVRVE